MENNRKVVNLNSFNQFVKFTQDKETLEFLFRQRKNLEKDLEFIAFGKASSEFLGILTLQIREFLTKKSIPKSWVDPFLTLITAGLMDYPLDNGISIKVGTHEVTNNKRKVILSTNPEAKLISDRSINIVISANVNISQIVKFLNNNKDYIKNLMCELGLPKTKPMSWKKTATALKIIELKDDKGLGFEEIADLLGEEVKFDADLAEKTYTNYSEQLSKSKEIF